MSNVHCPVQPGVDPWLELAIYPGQVLVDPGVDPGPWAQTLAQTLEHVMSLVSPHKPETYVPARRLDGGPKACTRLPTRGWMVTEDGGGGPRAQTPKSPKAQSPRAQVPKRPSVQEPKSPKAQDPRVRASKSPRVQEPQSPRVP